MLANTSYATIFDHNECPPKVAPSFQIHNYLPHTPVLPTLEAEEGHLGVGQGGEEGARTKVYHHSQGIHSTFNVDRQASHPCTRSPPSLPPPPRTPIQPTIPSMTCRVGGRSHYHKYPNYRPTFWESWDMARSTYDITGEVPGLHITRVLMLVTKGG